METGNEIMFCAGLMVCLSERLLKKLGADFRANITKRSTWFSEVILKPAAGFPESYFWAVRGRLYALQCEKPQQSICIHCVTWLKLGTHYTHVHAPCPQAVFTGRVGYTGDQHDPWTRVSDCQFLTPVFTKSRAVSTGVQNDARVHGHGRHCAHPWTRPVDTGSVYRALIVEFRSTSSFLFASRFCILRSCVLHPFNRLLFFVPHSPALCFSDDLRCQYDKSHYGQSRDSIATLDIGLRLLLPYSVHNNTNLVYRPYFNKVICCT